MSHKTADGIPALRRFQPVLRVQFFVLRIFGQFTWNNALTHRSDQERKSKMPHDVRIEKWKEQLHLSPQWALSRPGDPTGLGWYSHFHIRTSRASTDIHHLPGPQSYVMIAHCLTKEQPAFPWTVLQIRCLSLCLHWLTSAHSHLMSLVCSAITSLKWPPSLICLVLVCSKQRGNSKFCASLAGWSQGSNWRRLAQRCLPLVLTPQLSRAHQ